MSRINKARTNIKLNYNDCVQEIFKGKNRSTSVLHTSKWHGWSKVSHYEANVWKQTYWVAIIMGSSGKKTSLRGNMRLGRQR